MIFDLQLFGPASGIVPGENGSKVIKIESTGGVGTEAWLEGAEYAVGFEYENGKMAGLSIEVVDQRDVNYLDIDGDQTYTEGVDPTYTLTGTSVGTFSTGEAFSVGGNWITAATVYNDYMAFQIQGKTDVLMANGTWDAAASTNMSAAYAFRTTGQSADLTGAGFNADTAGYNDGIDTGVVRFIDLDGNGDLDVGEIITSVSMRVGNAFNTGTSTLVDGVYAFNGTWASVSIVEGTAVSGTEALAESEYNGRYLFQDGLVLGSVADENITPLTNLAAAAANGWSVSSFRTATVEGPDWNTTVSTFMLASSDVGWDANETRKISHIELTKNSLAGDLEAFTLDVNNGYMSSMSLENFQMNLNLTSVSKGGVYVDGLDSGASINRTINFTGKTNVTMHTVDETIENGAAYVKNGKYTNELLAGTTLTNVSVVGKKDGDLTFFTHDDTSLYFGKDSDSVFIDMKDMNALQTFAMRAEDTELVTVNNLNETLHIRGLKDDSHVLINAMTGDGGFVEVDDSNGQANNAVDINSTVSIIGAENSVTRNAQGVITWDAGNRVIADLSGKGIEYINIANHGADVRVANLASQNPDGTVNNDSGWVFTTRSIIGAKGANVVSIGDHDILDVEGAILGNKNAGAAFVNNGANLSNGVTRSNAEATDGNQWMFLGTHLTGSGDADKTSEDGAASRLVITSAATNRTDAEIEANAHWFGSYEGVKIESKGKEYNALMMSADALDSLDTGLVWDSYDIVVGDILNLGNRTDKKVVYLNNDIDKIDWGDTMSYSANMTSVISSSVGGSLIVGDFENSVNFRGEGHLDSLYGGFAYEHTSSRHVTNGGTTVSNVVVSVDTLSSAAGKKAWMGTSDNSGQTKVELLHNGSQTYNFGFVGEDYSVAGTSVSGTETQETGDVLALMHGMGVHSLVGSEHNRTNLIVGANASNNFTFQSISEGVHDIMYTWDLGANNHLARVDTSLGGSTKDFNYSDDVNFYLGFDNGTVLTMNAEDSGKMVNYGGTNVIVDISTIDGSEAAGGNMLNGQNDHAEYIIASDKLGDTLCGGLNNSYTDKGNDTLVGGEGADTFWVGDDMGNDVINNLTDGDTIVFLGSKFADATLNYENERMVDYADSHWMTVSFEGEDSTTKITITPGNGLTEHMSDLKNVTAVFDDGTYTWNGQQWTQA